MARYLPVKVLAILLVLSAILSACASNQALVPGLLESSSVMSSSLRSEQEVPKSGNQGSVTSSVDNLSPEGVVGEASFSDLVAAPENPSQEPSESAAAFVVPAMPTETTPTETVAEPPAPPPVDVSTPIGPKIGNRAPDFALQTLDGSTIALSDLLGKPLVINYWATWCIPCKEELPILEKLFQEYQSRGLLIVSVDAIEQDTTDKLQAVITQTGMTFPTLLDKGNQFADAYQSVFFPTSFFIDASGVIRDITLGDSSEEIFRQKTEKLLTGEF